MTQHEAAQRVQKVLKITVLLLNNVSQKAKSLEEKAIVAAQIIEAGKLQEFYKTVHPLEGIDIPPMPIS